MNDIMLPQGKLNMTFCAQQMIGSDQAERT